MTMREERHRLKIIKKGEARPREARPRKQELLNEKAGLMRRVRQIEKELQQA